MSIKSLQGRRTSACEYYTFFGLLARQCTLMKNDKTAYSLITTKVKQKRGRMIQQRHFFKNYL